MLDLLDGVNGEMLSHHAQPHQREHLAGSPVQHIDEPLENNRKNAHGLRSQQRIPLRVVQRGDLGHLFAEHDVQAGDDDQREESGSAAMSGPSRSSVPCKCTVLKSGVSSPQRYSRPRRPMPG